jgi:hypothetical protein
MFLFSCRSPLNIIFIIGFVVEQGRYKDQNFFKGPGNIVIKKNFITQIYACQGKRNP